MSLLDDVSIVVTPNGYKAGELYAVIPVPTEGAELLTNGDFATDSDWSKGTGWTISGGSANCDGSQTGNTNLNPTIIPSIANGQTYLLSLDVTLSAGTLSVFAFSSGALLTETSIGTNTLTLYFTKGAGGNLYIQGNADFIGSVDNVSVKEYTSADIDVTRATAATRVDEDGLVNYAEVIGSEEITNGDFATNLDYWSTSSWWVWNSLGAYHPSTSSHKPLYQQCCVIGKTYLITFDLNCIGSSQAKFSLGSSTGSTTQVIGTSLTSGSYSYFVTAAAEYIVFNRQNTAEYYVNNVSVKEVTRDNVPRIDYTGGGCPHILAEPQRTNTLTYSEDFSEWITSGTTPTLTTGQLAPDGTLGATKISGTIGSSLIYLGGSSSSTTATRTIYARTVSGTGTARLMSRHHNVNNLFTLTEEWTRFELTGSDSLGGGDFYIDMRGSQTLSEFIIWGAQSEEATYATSYIPTSGSTVTRNQDIFTRDGIGSLINSTEGVLFAEIAATSLSSNYDVITLSDGTVSNIVAIFYLANTKSININVKQLGASVFTGYASTITYPPLDFHKIALKYKTGDFALWIDGTEVLTGSGALTNLGLSNLQLADGNGTSNKFFGKVRQLQVYTEALSDEQLLQLTGESGTDFYESYAEMASALTYTIQ